MLTDNDRESDRDLRVYLETFGCQMNILDSELIEGQLRAAGHSFVDKADDANVVLLNTCSVRDLSEHKVLSRLGKLRDRKIGGEKLVVGVLGCMAERASESLAKTKPFIDLMVGPSKIKDTKALVEKAFYNSQQNVTSKSLSGFVNRKGPAKIASLNSFDDLEALDQKRVVENRHNPWLAYVRITRGCNKFCSFCVVPRTRGPEMHRPPESIIDEVKRLVDSGAKEVCLLGQTINHYFYDAPGKTWSFADLLFQIHEQVPALLRLRFLTSYPRDFTDDALDVMASCDRISKYLHIPAQSGSDKVLREMNRGYDLATYMSLINRARSRMPNISFLGDMIVGFPNETDEDFAQSLDLLRDVRYKNVYIFKYSPRPNTVANKRFADNVPMDVKKARNNTMLAVQREITLEDNQKLVGTTVSVLCEGESKLDPHAEANNLVQLRSKKPTTKLIGRSCGDHIVHFDGHPSMIGTIIDLRITEARALSLGGSIVG